MGIDLETLTDRQCGVFTRQQALAAGCPPAEVRRRLRQGDWVPLRTGVYAPGQLLGGPRRPVATAVAGWLALGRRGAVSHGSAALLHRLALLREPEVADLTFPPGTLSPHAYSRLATHTAGLPAGHLTTCGDVPVTTVARTVVDLARSLPAVAAVVTADDALRQRLVRRADLQRVVAECPAWPGIRAAADLVAFADGRSESPVESVCRLLFARHDLPAPVPQGLVVDQRDGWWARVDFLWPALGTVVEVDPHAELADAAQLQRQRARQERLEDLGYAVVRVTWSQLSRQPSATIDRVRRAFVRGATVLAYAAGPVG